MFFLNATLSLSYGRVGQGTVFSDRLEPGAKKGILKEASRILGAAVPRPTYLPEGCKIQDIYAQDNLVRLLISDKEIEKKQIPGKDFAKLLISEEEIKKRGARVGEFAFSSRKPYIFESKMGIGIKWHPEGKAGGLKLYGEQITINQGKGILVDQEMCVELCWLLTEQCTRKQPGQYEIVLRANKLVPKDELLKVAQSVII
jgi:hypothetical protein